MSGLKSRLIFRKNRIPETLRYLAACGRPIGLIGGGVYAKTLCGALPRYGIDPVFIILDKEYKKNDMLYGLPVMTPDDCAVNHSDAVLIIAYNYRYEEEWRILKRETDRYSPDIDVIALGAVFLNGMDWISEEYILENMDGFEKTYALLKDDLSRRIMAEFLNARMSGDARNLLLFNTDSVNDYELSLIFSSEREGAVVECGAFDGRSALQTDAFTKGLRRIYALEPGQDTYDRLCGNIKDHDLIIPVMAGVADREYTTSMYGDGGTAGLSDEEEEGSVRVTTVDSLLKDEKASAIIMDIEGSELAALKGARKTILRDRPVLAVRVYHRREDLIEIPGYIASLPVSREYDLFLRVNNTQIGTYDVTLYAL